MCVCVCGGGGGTLIFSYIDVVCDHFWGFKILNFNIFGGFLKSDYFLGYEIFVGIYHHKVSRGAKIRNRYDQVPHLTQENWIGFSGRFYTF